MIHLHHTPIALRKRSLALLVFAYTIAPTEVQPGTTPTLVSDAWFRQFEAARTELNRSSTGRLLGLVLFGRSRLRGLNFRFSPGETVKTYVSYVHRFLFLRGKFRISGRGLLVAFTGIDGSGKSSAVEDFRRSDFLRSTGGVTSMYFGNHSFWIPGLANAVRKHRGASALGVIVMGLSVIDRKLRILPALWARANGRVVLCDRYFYDQNIGDPTEKYLRNRALKAVVNPVVSWIPARPDASFYLRVDPAAAHARKPEDDLEQAESTSAAYDTLATVRDEITIIDANQSLDDVITAVRAGIADRFRAIGPKSAR
jgi:thymidylate kinase